MKCCSFIFAPALLAGVASAKLDLDGLKIDFDKFKLDNMFDLDKLGSGFKTGGDPKAFPSKEDKLLNCAEDFVAASCPAGTVIFPNAQDVCCTKYRVVEEKKGIEKREYFCDADTCCQQTCSGYQCPSGSIPFPDAEGVFCEDGTCSDDECCQFNCDSFDASGCPTGFELVDNPSEKFCPRAETPGGDACDSANCCRPTCASFDSGTCLSGQVPKPDLETIFCETDPCTTTECCDNTCATLTPTCGSDGSSLDKLDDQTQIICPSTGCSPAVCCDIVCSSLEDDFCTSDTAGSLLKAIPGLIRCPTRGCDPETCCEDTCSSDNQCLTGDIEKSSPGAIRCPTAGPDGSSSPNGCSRDLCCNPTCASTDQFGGAANFCGSATAGPNGSEDTTGFLAKGPSSNPPSPTQGELFCPPGGCTVDLCCDATCVSFQNSDPSPGGVCGFGNNQSGSGGIRCPFGVIEGCDVELCCQVPPEGR
mmetsp:Transcript_39655/g.78095  ORF Transcript_39655/g.78095 Transcript_39655/m.78095 type:complete len:476 (-) Transcript_39655:241-1668(-)